MTHKDLTEKQCHDALPWMGKDPRLKDMGRGWDCIPGTESVYHELFYGLPWETFILYDSDKNRAGFVQFIDTRMICYAEPGKMDILKDFLVHSSWREYWDIGRSIWVPYDWEQAEGLKECAEAAGLGYEVI